ncbi:hypothetical protein [Effusibacillus pohliae]|uniref:hypothetical protein n=1 Tax=Effusibacillus pohliae TaxID=232270 RepID=UPI00037E1CAF|nr:hypothetical protein [Effusibacillus pohliae]
MLYEEKTGFFAVATARNGLFRYPLTEQDLIGAVAVYLADCHRFDPHGLTMELFFEPGKGVWAVIDQMRIS